MNVTDGEQDLWGRCSYLLLCYLVLRYESRPSVAGALTLAEYNDIVEAHNRSVELFEELCGAAPELYL